jgi:hypothetical protein
MLSGGLVSSKYVKNGKTNRKQRDLIRLISITNFKEWRHKQTARSSPKPHYRICGGKIFTDRGPGDATNLNFLSKREK